MKVVEKTGTFYLGKLIDPSKKKGSSDDNPFLYEAKNFVTHAVCVGMTGSGKTGLCIDILEEAAMNKIPAIIIDPKGDLGNLLLTFPHLSPAEFLPWIDEAEAERKGMPPKEYAEAVAKTWQEGLAKWGEGTERIQNLRNSVDMTIYTPASRAGVPLSILSSFAAPSKEMMLDPEAVRQKVLSITSGLLGLLGIAADPIKSREHILISTIIDRAWNNGTDLDIAAIIQQVQKPPFDKIGALDTDTFFPQKERMALSISLNNLLASPGFQAWLEGDPLDIQQLLYTKEGKPKLSILSIAHLSDSERMFFVTLLLNEMIAWMRKQSGTSNLRALLYMDEIFGFFPPTAMPPSKLPMLTLLKQARAFGLGVILATQNPVDLDYKGLSNCGTWFIGKLQTERDKSRVLEGLSAASNGEMDSASLDKMLALTGNRVFILRSIYEPEPLLFETRWTLSYLRGPLTLPQINKLTNPSDRPSPNPEPAKRRESGSSSESKPALPAGMQEYFMRNPKATPPLKYQPQVMGLAKLHFIDAKNKIDTWQETCLIAPFDESAQTVLWEEGTPIPDWQNQLDKAPLSGSSFAELPGSLMNQKNYASFEKSLIASLYQNQEITLYQAPELNLLSKNDESEAEFRSRIAPDLRERKEEALKKIEAKFTDKKIQLTEKVRRAQDKINDKQHKALWQKLDAFLSFLTTILGALLGRGITKGTITQTGTSIRRAGRIGKESQGASQAEEDLQMLQQQLDDLQVQQNQEIAQINASYDPNAIKLETVKIRPRKSDISIERTALVWVPVA